MKRRKPCFFKFLLPNLSDKRLEIPKAFLKHLDGEYSDTAYLRGPTGTIWKLKLGEDRRGCLFLVSGWKRFVEVNSIQAGYCLVFRYHGNLRFTVKIFGTTLCMVVHGLDPSSPYPVDSGDGSETIKRSCEFSSDGYNATRKNDASEFGRCGHLVESSSDSESNEELDKPLSPKRTSSTTQLSVKRKAGRHICYELMSQRRPVTKIEIKRAYDAAKSFRSKNPFGLVVMRQSYVYYGFLLALPKAFVESALPKTSLPMTLVEPVSGKEWEVKYVYNERNQAAALSAGWVTFTLANNIEEHDVCVFELIEKNQIQVNIFRVVDEIVSILRPSKRIIRS